MNIIYKFLICSHVLIYAQCTNDKALESDKALEGDKASVFFAGICKEHEISLREKSLNLSSSSEDGVLTESLFIDAVFRNVYTVEELFCYLELIKKDDIASNYSILANICHYLGRENHNMALHYYYTKLCGVKVKYITENQFVFPDQKIDNYAIHQHAELLGSILSGWYSSVNESDKSVVSLYIKLLSEKFNNIYTLNDVRAQSRKFNQQ